MKVINTEGFLHLLHENEGDEEMADAIARLFEKKMHTTCTLFMQVDNRVFTAAKEGFEEERFTVNEFEIR